MILLFIRMGLLPMRVHGWSETKWFFAIITTIDVWYATVYVRMFLVQRSRPYNNCNWICFSFAMCITLSFVLSRNPRPHTVHLNFSRASVKWNFLCFIRAFLLADIFPQIEHTSGTCMCLTRMCSRRLFLLRDLKSNTRTPLHSIPGMNELMAKFSPIFAYVALQPWLDVVHESMMWFMRIYIVRYIAAQIAHDPLIFIVVEFDVQRQIV